MQITPSLLEKNADDLFKNILKLVPFYNSFQIDIADGVDVPNNTIKIEDFAGALLKNQQLIVNLLFEFHLMVKDYFKTIDEIMELKNKIKIRNILIHAKYLPNIELLKFQYSLPFGLVIYPEDSIKLITDNYNLENIPYIQIMSCRVGFKGTPFIAESLNKIEQLRIVNYRNIISLDGGINDKSLVLIKSLKHKPDILCPNSFLTTANNLIERVKYLKEITEEAG